MIRAQLIDSAGAVRPMCGAKRSLQVAKSDGAMMIPFICLRCNKSNTTRVVSNSSYTTRVVLASLPVSDILRTRNRWSYATTWIEQ
jgi:hypothetical protein